MTTLDLFQVRTLRVDQYDRGMQAYYQEEPVTAHGLPEGHRHIADFVAGWNQAELADRSALYRAETQRLAVLLARGA